MYKRQVQLLDHFILLNQFILAMKTIHYLTFWVLAALLPTCLLYTSDAADERSSVDLGGRRIIKKKQKLEKV